MSFMTINELAQHTRTSRASIYNLIAANNGPRITKIGGKTLFAREDVEAWLESCKRDTLRRAA